MLTVVADASGLALDAVVDAAFAGRTGETEAQLAKAAEAGTSAGAVVSAALRHVAQLHKARLAVDAGERADMALNNFVPPVHFSRRSKVEAAVSAWSAPKLARAMEQLAEAALSIRRTPALADSLGQRAVLQVATTARRNGR